MSSYITIQEAENRYKKSQATFRRLATKLKGKKTNNIKFEQLSTGHKKILFKLSYLDEIFNYSPSDHNKENDQSFNSSTNNSNVLEILHEQLREKDKQIETLLQRSHEQNVIIQTLQEKTLLLEAPKKKRWWQRR